MLCNLNTGARYDAQLFEMLNRLLQRIALSNMREIVLVDGLKLLYPLSQKLARVFKSIPYEMRLASILLYSFEVAYTHTTENTNVVNV
ncbi:hypothetical protein [secondary endosymbiont of Ctenarytaina eucalypti]|uniref:hypothetical protein n=1 Tax=secondary endosymbiont of Ctenarytaina eucalypti TaxID=1199245 RepID=UPI00135CE246|nr:hypothetical protein [secondary endosymbiont of Ctenarytaina eucalypti]